MSEWWSYRPSDFLLFSARTWHRLFELYNAGIWPAHFFAVALGLALVLAALKARPGPGARSCCALLAVCWLWVAWAFHLQRYAAINWAATWFAAAFAIEGVLLLCAAAAGLELREARGSRERLGLGLLLFAVLIQPWLSLLLLGRPWREAGLFGLVPDPTALGTLGLLLLLRAPPPARLARGLVLLLWPIPLLWCLIAALTLWTLHAQGGFQGALPSVNSVADGPGGSGLSSRICESVTPSAPACLLARHQASSCSKSPPNTRCLSSSPTIEQCAALARSSSVRVAMRSHSR
jgi:hypothetical protein